MKHVFSAAGFALAGLFTLLAALPPIRSALPWVTKPQTSHVAFQSQNLKQVERYGDHRQYLEVVLAEPEAYTVLPNGKRKRINEEWSVVVDAEFAGAELLSLTF